MKRKRKKWQKKNKSRKKGGFKKETNLLCLPKAQKRTMVLLLTNFLMIFCDLYVPFFLQNLYILIWFLSINMASRRPSYISSLNLNFLDIKFKSLKQESIAHPSKKHSKNVVLPSLNSTEMRNDTTGDVSSLMPTQLSTIPDHLDLYEYIQEISKMKEINSVHTK